MQVLVCQKSADKKNLLTVTQCQIINLTAGSIFATPQNTPILVPWHGSGVNWQLCNDYWHLAAKKWLTELWKSHWQNFLTLIAPSASSLTTVRFLPVELAPPMLDTADGDGSHLILPPILLDVRLIKTWREQKCNCHFSKEIIDKWWHNRLLLLEQTGTDDSKLDLVHESDPAELC